MSDEQRDITSRILSWVLSTINLPKLAAGLYLWSLRRVHAWAHEEIERLNGDADEPEVIVSVTRKGEPPTGPPLA